MRATQTTSFGDRKAEHDRGCFFVVEHQRRKPRACAQAVAAADSRLAVDGDPELVQRDDVASDRPLAHTQLAGRGPGIDHPQTLEEFEEAEESGGRPRDTEE